MLNKKSKENIVKLFSKYCQKCDGRCCKVGMVTFFECEALSVFNKEEGIKSIFIKEKCSFLKNKKCILGAKKPIDCVTFPIYPILESKSIKDNSIKLAIHKSCPYYKEMIQDRKLCMAIENLWKVVFKKETTRNVVNLVGR